MLYSTISLQLDIYVIILRDGAIAVIQRLAVAQFDLRALHHIAVLLLREQEGIIVNVKLAAAVLTQNRAVVGLGGIFRRQAPNYFCSFCGKYTIVFLVFWVIEE